MASNKRITQVLQREFTAGKVFRVDMGLVDVAPDGSAGILRSLPVVGDRDKIKEGDPVKIVSIAGQRMALVGDLASEETIGLAPSDTGSTTERAAAIVEKEETLSSRGIYEPATGDVLVYDGKQWINMTSVPNADKLGGVAPAYSGNLERIVKTDASGAIASGNALYMAERATPATPGAGWGMLYMGNDSWPRVMTDEGHNLPLSLAHVLVSANQWQPAAGAALTYINATPILGREFRDGFGDAMDFMLPLPAGWNTRALNVDLCVICNAVGNVVWGVQGRYIRSDLAISSTIDVSATAVVAGAGWAARYPVLNCGTLNHAAGNSLALRVFRAGTDAQDTAAASAYVVSVKIRVV